MRIGSSNPTTDTQQTQSTQSTQTAQRSTVADNVAFQGGQTTTRPSTSGTSRASENVGANLLASQLRSASAPSLSKITDNLAGNMKTGQPAGGTDKLVTTGASTNVKAILDNKTITDTIAISDDLSVTGLSVNVNISHTYRGDLVVKLKSPDGKEITLKNREGGSADNLVFTANPSDFNGLNSKGNWTLSVTDAAAQDTGKLNSWGLSINGNPKTGGGTGGGQTGKTSLQVIGDSAFRAKAAADLAKFAPGTTVDAQGYVHEATSKVAGHTTGYQLINNLLSNSNLVTIGFVSNNAFTSSGTGAQGTPSRPAAGSTAQVSYDPALDIALPTLQADGTIRDESISSEVVLAHELVHATHAQRGTIDRSLVNHTFTDGNQKYTENWRFEEFRTTGFPGQRQGSEPSENSIRGELGYKPRATYLDRSSWTPVNS